MGIPYDNYHNHGTRLRSAYFDARYKKTYKITRAELEYALPSTNFEPRTTNSTLRTANFRGVSFSSFLLNET